MTSFAPGTPPSVIKRLEKQMAKRMDKAAKTLPKDLKRGVVQVQPTKPTGTKAVPLKKVKTPQPVTKAVQGFRKQLNNGMGNNGPIPTQAPTPAPTVAPKPRPHIDEGFGNGGGRPLPSGQTILNKSKTSMVGSASRGGAMDGVGGMKRGGNVSSRADGAAKKGKTKGRYI
jgi:hypothetical protein